METYPLNTGDFCHTFNEFRYMLFTVEIYAIVGQLLCNDIKLFRTIFHQLAYLVEDFFHRTTMMMPRNQRDRTIGTMAITTLTDLQVSIMARRRDMPMIISYLQLLISLL